MVPAASPHRSGLTETRARPSEQLLLLRRAEHPPIAGAPRPPLLVQHHLGRDEEGGRALKLLAGGA